MTKPQAKPISRQIIESGYEQWLHEQLRARAIARFEGAQSDEDLRHARILMDCADLARSVIIDNSK